MGREDPNTTKSGPSSAQTKRHFSAHQRNTIEMAFRWHADDGPMVFRWRADDGLTSKCWLGGFVILQEIRTPAPTPSGSAHGRRINLINLLILSTRKNALLIGTK